MSTLHPLYAVISDLLFPSWPFPCLNRVQVTPSAELRLDFSPQLPLEPVESWRLDNSLHTEGKKLSPDLSDQGLRERTPSWKPQ